MKVRDDHDVGAAHFEHLNAQSIMSYDNLATAPRHAGRDRDKEWMDPSTYKFSAGSFRTDVFNQMDWDEENLFE